MKYLWSYPKSLAKILSVTNIQDSHILAPFITNNLYENYFSSNGKKEEQLLYIISLLLKEEINNFQSKEPTSFEFLVESPASCIFKELIYKKDVIKFFNTILIDIIKEIETINSQDKITFDLNEINDIIQKRKSSKENKKDLINKLDKKENTLNIFFCPLNRTDLKDKYSKSEDKDLKNFLKKKIDLCELNPSLFSNEKIFEKISNFNIENSKEISSYYRQSFNEIINLINILFKNLLSYADSAPYLIKCICKIISSFIQKKYPNIDNIERNTFLSKFFFENLLFIVFDNPDIKALINQHLVTEKSLDRFKIIKMILKDFITNELFYVNDEFVVFNNFLIEKLPDLKKFFNIITKVTLPTFIEDLINDKLTENYEYDYFEENKEENIFYRAICFNTDILYSLIENAEKCKDKLLFNNKSDSLALNKLIEKKNLLEEIRQKEKKENDNYQIIGSIKHILFLDVINNKKYDKLINMKNEKKYFNIKELKKIETDLEKTQNNIIKTKNLLCALLYNYPTLNKNEFINEYLNNINIINILKEMKNQSKINSFDCSTQNIEDSNILKKLSKILPILENKNFKKSKNLNENLNTISNALKEIKHYLDKKCTTISDQQSNPIQWFINSLIQCLRLLPKEYILNDYNLLLKELEEDIKKSINDLDFEFLANEFEHLNELKKNKYYYKKVKDTIIDIDLNKKTKSIIEKEIIPINLIFTNNKLEINSLGDSYFIFMYKKEEGMTIKSFVEEFPNIIQLKENKNIFDFMKEIELPLQLENYFKIIKKNIEQKNLIEKNNLNEINNKIYDYVMEKLYDKLFPKEPNIKDISIKNNCQNIVWIEYYNLIKTNKNYLMDSFLPDAISFFKNINEEKSPRKKLLNLKGIFNCIFNIGKLNGINIEGVDDEMILLNYIFIKAKPDNIYNNCKYIELFLGEKKNEIEGQKLTELIGICEKMENFEFKDLNDITISEYEENCDLVKKGILY